MRMIGWAFCHDFPLHFASRRIGCRVFESYPAMLKECPAPSVKSVLFVASTFCVLPKFASLKG
jgi:hypothetical protein